MFSIYKKELKSYFTSFIGYVYLTIFVLSIGFNFIKINLASGSGAFSLTLHYSTIIFLILIPMLTMRLFSDEMKNKTDQLLYTSPIKIRSIVIGKYLAALTLFVIGMLIVAIYPIIIYTTDSLPVAETLGSIIGYIFLIGAFISVGLFISSLTENQIIAAIGSFGALFTIYMSETIATVLPKDSYSALLFIISVFILVGFILYRWTKNILFSILGTAIPIVIALILYGINRNIYEELFFKVVSLLSLLKYFQSFTIGLINISDIFYFISFILIFLQLTVYSIEKQRWN